MIRRVELAEAFHTASFTKASAAPHGDRAVEDRLLGPHADSGQVKDQSLTKNIGEGHMTAKAKSRFYVPVTGFVGRLVRKNWTQTWIDTLDMEQSTQVPEEWEETVQAEEFEDQVRMVTKWENQKDREEKKKKRDNRKKSKAKKEEKKKNEEGKENKVQ